MQAKRWSLQVAAQKGFGGDASASRAVAPVPAAQCRGNPISPAPPGHSLCINHPRLRHTFTVGACLREPEEKARGAGSRANAAERRSCAMEDPASRPRPPPLQKLMTLRAAALVVVRVVDTTQSKRQDV